MVTSKGYCVHLGKMSYISPLMNDEKIWTLHFHFHVLTDMISCFSLTLVFCLMPLFHSPRYWHIFDELLVCSSSSVDTGYGGEKRKKSRAKWNKGHKSTLPQRLLMIQGLFRSLFLFLLRQRQTPFVYDIFMLQIFFYLKNNVCTIIW